MVGTKTTKTVTIEKRGAFGDDPFFKDSLDEWDHAMKKVVDRWDKPSATTTTTTTTTKEPTTETRSVYRNIRSSNVTSDDSQAVSCTEEDDKYKMMVDVKDFKPEDINVKTVDDTVVIEGKIEKKEGNAVSTQKFTRRFILPPGVNLNAISSALSRDGVLTINAPKLAIKGEQGHRSIPVAGTPHKNGATIFTRFNPTEYDYDGDDKRYLKHTPLHNDGEITYNTRGGGGNVVIGTTLGNSSGHVVPLHPESSQSGDHWKSFNQMVEKSQREMEDMMRRHTLQQPGLNPPTSPPSMSTNVVISTENSRPPAGTPTSRDISITDKNVTERKEQRWTDKPAPGVTRTNRVLNENTALKGADGSVVGNKSRKEQESHAEGSNQEILPDGTKKSTFTKSYETKKVYSYNSSDPKAV